MIFCYFIIKIFSIFIFFIYFFSKKEIISKIQSGELKASISDVNSPIPESIIILLTIRPRSDYRTTEILSFEQAVESFDADPANEFIAFTHKYNK